MSKTTRAKRCGACRHWSAEEWAPGRRVCRRIHAIDSATDTQPAEPAYTLFSDGWLVTTDAFGCALFERSRKPW